MLCFCPTIKIYIIHFLLLIYFFLLHIYDLPLWKLSKSQKKSLRKQQIPPEWNFSTFVLNNIPTHNKLFLLMQYVQAR